MSSTISGCIERKTRYSKGVVLLFCLLCGFHCRTGTTIAQIFNGKESRAIVNSSLATITVLKVNDQQPARGVAFIVHEDNASIFLITAKHVVKDARTIRLKLAHTAEKAVCIQAIWDKDIGIDATGKNKDGLALLRVAKDIQSPSPVTRNTLEVVNFQPQLPFQQGLNHYLPKYDSVTNTWLQCPVILKERSNPNFGYSPYRFVIQKSTEYSRVCKAKNSNTFSLGASGSPVLDSQQRVVGVLIDINGASYFSYLTMILRDIVRAPAPFGTVPRGSLSASTNESTTLELKGPKLPVCSLNETELPLAAKSNVCIPKFNTAVVYVPSGQFQIGSGIISAIFNIDEFPSRSVYVNGFFIQQTEFNLRTWRSISIKQRKGIPKANHGLRLGKNASALNPLCSHFRRAGPGYPVTCATWPEARNACGIFGGDLPTEAEWEYAARGGLYRAKFPWGDEIKYPATLSGINYAPGIGNSDHLPLQTVIEGYNAETGVQNNYGLYHIAGNVREWVLDPYDGAAYFSLNSRRPTYNPLRIHKTEYRITRGGSWALARNYTRVSHRFYSKQNTRAPDVGFRCVIRLGALLKASSCARTQ